ncbi:hypothetical protein OG205_05395 [Lentzea sp. NBC_00516]|uniref:hypothetical protein n=1 Tax=Lentzea sp. NBC_00516 TaxID=2903582 RepID=UPI002E7FE578|nr:hypothetical protein [Lentzea sp. NBC_00516]WUD26443.1 hypothetical protein OG205_05395 [Lentzea sp. NBC_00516]
MFKKITAALAVAGAVLLGLAAPASAGIEANPDCQNDNGFQTVVTTGPIKSISTGDRIGTIYLCREGSLYFAFALYEQTFVTNQTAQVWLQRFDNGNWVGEVNCDTEPGGNQHIEKGQRRCWTPNLNGDAARYTFRALSEKYIGNNLIANGATATRR